MVFPNFIDAFRYDDELTKGNSQYIPIWDRELFAFDTELDPYLMYAHKSIYTLDGEGYLHFYVQKDCSFGLEPCLEYDVTYTITGKRGMEYNMDTSCLEVVSGSTYYVDNDCDGIKDSDTTLTFKLPHVVDSPDYLIFNSHQHADEYERMEKPARVLRNLGWGGEVWFHTGHYHHSYYEETMDKMNLGSAVVSILATEDFNPSHVIVAPHYTYSINPDYYGINHVLDPGSYCDPLCPLNSNTCQRYCRDIGQYYYENRRFKWGSLSPFYTSRLADYYEEKSGHPALFLLAHPYKKYGY
jgi:hypothetical protein